MAKDKTPAPIANAAPEPQLRPPTTGGAFERMPGGELKPIEESAERAQGPTPSEPSPTSEEHLA